MTDDERRGRELVERVARAIYDAATLYIRAADRPVLRADWEANPDQEWTRAQARAAIVAMRDHVTQPATPLHDGKAVSGKLDERWARYAAKMEADFNVSAGVPDRPEGEARAAGGALADLLGHDGTSPGHVPLSMYSTMIAELKRRAEAAEALAKAEREQRESEAEAYRNEIEQLKAALHRIQHLASPFLNAARDIAREALEGRTGT